MGLEKEPGMLQKVRLPHFFTFLLLTGQMYLTVNVIKKLLLIK
jgi:hypothetical protein